MGRGHSTHPAGGVTAGQLVLASRLFDRLDLRHLVQTDLLAITDYVRSVERDKLEFFDPQHLAVGPTEPIGPAHPAVPSNKLPCFGYSHFFSLKTAATSRDLDLQLEADTKNRPGCATTQSLAPDLNRQKEISPHGRATCDLVTAAWLSCQPTPITSRYPILSFGTVSSLRPRLAGLDPWLCVPRFPKVCLYRILAIRFFHPRGLCHVEGMIRAGSYAGFGDSPHVSQVRHRGHKTGGSTE